jgi:hypothetical protein
MLREDAFSSPYSYVHTTSPATLGVPMGHVAATGRPRERERGSMAMSQPHFNIAEDLWMSDLVSDSPAHSLFLCTSITREPHGWRQAEMTARPSADLSNKAYGIFDSSVISKKGQEYGVLVRSLMILYQSQQYQTAHAPVDIRSSGCDQFSTSPDACCDACSIWSSGAQKLVTLLAVTAEQSMEYGVQQR